MQNNEQKLCYDCNHPTAATPKPGHPPRCEHCLPPRATEPGPAWVVQAPAPIWNGTSLVSPLAAGFVVPTRRT
jgi:hypothetical protein